MKDRCLNSKSAVYRYYGGRGISICERWGQFENFLADMGEAPAGRSLDRINNDGNYEPGNCRWATHSEQLNNTRKNVWIEHNGVRRTSAQWARHFNISRGTMHSRLKIWDSKKSLTAKKTIVPMRITFNGMTLNVNQWAKHLGIPRTTIRHRLKIGWPLDDVFRHR